MGFCIYAIYILPLLLLIQYMFDIKLCKVFNNSFENGDPVPFTTQYQQLVHNWWNFFQFKIPEHPKRLEHHIVKVCRLHQVTLHDEFEGLSWEQAKKLIFQLINMLHKSEQIILTSRSSPPVMVISHFLYQLETCLFLHFKL